MRGTEKQIRWAEDLRETYKHNAGIIRNDCIGKETQFAKLISLLDSIEEFLDSMEYAGNVIDHFQGIRKATDGRTAYQQIQGLMVRSEEIIKIAQNI